MSATRDKSQKITFVYSNLYEIYKKGKKAAEDAKAAAAESSAVAPGVAPGLTTSEVLKTDDLNTETFAVSPRAGSVKVEAPAATVAAIHAKPDLFKQNPTLESLKQNLKTLNDLHSRLRFMLEELEELVKN